MGKHSKPTESDDFYDRLWGSMTEPVGEGCPAHKDGTHYYGTISIDESECRCGARIRANNSGHG